MDVKIKDRKDDIEYLRMALAMAEVGVSYEHADLINRVVNSVRKRKGKFSIHDGVSLLYQWKEDWRQYVEVQKKESEEIKK
jgi:hypothetical protein